MEIGDELIQTVSKNLKAERLQAGLSQKKLAEKSGLSIRYLSRLETNPQNFRIDKVAIIAEAMGIPPARLLTRPRDSYLGPAAGETLSEAIRLLEGLRARAE